MTKTENVIGCSLGCLAILAMLGSIAGQTTLVAAFIDDDANRKTPPNRRGQAL